MKKKSTLLIALSLVVIILTISFFEKKNREHPILIGSYQSETMPPDIYMLSFNKEGEYEAYYNSVLVEQGSFSKVNDTETYVIESDTEKQLLVLLEEDEFYYYSPDNKVFLLKNLDKTPTRLNQN